MIYVAISEDEPVFASESFEEVDYYAEERNSQEIDAILKEWGIEDPEEKDIEEATIQAGFDGKIFDVVSVDLLSYSEEDEIELSNGIVIDYNDIIELLEKNNSSDFFEGDSEEDMFNETTIPQICPNDGTQLELDVDPDGFGGITSARMYCSNCDFSQELNEEQIEELNHDCGEEDEEGY